MPNLSKKIIGITGNIACGKSLLTKYLIDKGYCVIDADDVTNELYEKNEDSFKDAMINLFSEDILSDNGEIDKAKVANLVFNDMTLLEKLNNILHPIIISRVRKLIKESDKQLIFVSAALLYEANWQKNADDVILVRCSEINQIERLVKRNKYSKEQALKRINSFISQDVKSKMATYVIDNDSSVEDLYKKADEILKKIEKVN